MILFTLLACTPHDTDPDTLAGALTQRAYVVSAASNELFVFDHETLAELGSVDTTVQTGANNGNHMAMVTPDGAKVYVTAASAGSLIVLDAATLTVKKTLPIGGHTTHMALREDRPELWLMAEDNNAVIVLNTETDTVTHTITDPSIHIPHFARFSGDRAYVPSIGGNNVSIIDLETYRVVDTLVGEGLTEGPCEGDPCGYADAQIDPNGVLFAANYSTGKVIVYDTVTGERLPDVAVGGATWSAFVNPFAEEGSYAFVPSWASSTVSRVDLSGAATIWAQGDSEVYGVNFSAQAPDEAFVLNRVKHEVRVLDRERGELITTLDVGGTTETGTTTPSGRLLLPISSSGEVIVIDTATHAELARFGGVGTYPWSVATADGQNYCH
ncbi:YncE family protein [Myxococcota bacterium]|nr:YncE family protein [Myxococcota bacterium]